MAPRVALICDLKEEGWPSMDLVADMLYKHLLESHSARVETILIRPQLKSRFQKMPFVGNSKAAYTTDRFLKRLYDYDRFIKTLPAFDVYHLMDHSYSHLVHSLPANRTIVTCHDLDTFRCLLEPDKEPRSKPFRMMMQKAMDGFRQAAHVTCDSQTIYDQLRDKGLMAQDRMSVVHNGVDEIFFDASRKSENELFRYWNNPDMEMLNLLHVGSTIPRKRIDFLIQVVASIRNHRKEARLIKAGGTFTSDQKKEIEMLRLRDTVQFPFLEPDLLAALYRKSSIVLMTSEREGFGLPVLEALASGTPVVASDIPVFREIGGTAASYCAPGDVNLWTQTVLDLLEERAKNPEKWKTRIEEGIQHARKFRWSDYASQMVDLYQKILKQTPRADTVA